LSIGRRSIRWIVAVSAVLLSVGVAEMMLVLEGVVPSGRMVIELETPLYPYNYTYIYSIMAVFGRGIYTVTIEPNANIDMYVSCGNSSAHLSASRGDAKTVRLVCEEFIGINIFITARMEPYATSAGTLRVSRTWR